jgi:hypothetical protein
VQEGLATATPETVHAAKRPIEVVRVRITDAGRLHSRWNTSSKGYHMNADCAAQQTTLHLCNL